MEKFTESANAATNMKLIYDKLVAGEKLTVASVQRTVGTTELRHYIAKIKKNYNVEINSEWVHDSERQWKIYSLKQAAWGTKEYLHRCKMIITWLPLKEYEKYAFTLFR